MVASSDIARHESTLHCVATSLRDVPLIRYLYSNDLIPIEERPIDANWQYSGAIAKKLSGFDPLSGHVFIPSSCLLKHFLSANADYSPFSRISNAKAWLEYEVLYAIHDYFHAWVMQQAYSCFRRELSDYTDPDSRRLMLGCLSVSEVAATVGLDYWYVSRILRHFPHPKRCLATRYKTGQFSDQDALVQDITYFDKILTLYFQRLFLLPDVNTIPISWYAKEKRQASLFVETMKTWTDFCFGPTTQCATQDLVSTQQLLSEFSESIRNQLWNATRNSEFSCFGTTNGFDNIPHHKGSFFVQPIDFRFYNIHAHEHWSKLGFVAEPKKLSRRQYGYALAQYIVSFNMSQCEQLTEREFIALVDNRDLKEVEQWCDNRDPIDCTISQRQAMIFPN